MDAHHDEAWRRVGRLLEARRGELHPSYTNRTAFAKATGLNVKMLSDIEKATRTNFSSAMLAAIEVGYEIKAGGIQAVLDGAKMLPPREKPNPFKGADDLEEAINKHPDLDEEAKRTLLNVYRAYRDKI